VKRPLLHRARGGPALPAHERARTVDAVSVLGHDDASLLDVVDNVLNKGVVVSGDLTIALAQVDLIYARLSLLLCAADRILPDGESVSQRRRDRRHTQRSVGGG
jgi:hypothetical protein